MLAICCQLQSVLKLCDNVFSFASFVGLFDCVEGVVCLFNPLSAELNPICHLLALLGAHHIFHFSRIRVNIFISRFGIGK
jgi:hypothetical protein